MGAFPRRSAWCLFDPVFNLADACVSVGIISMLLFCRKELESLGDGKKKAKSADEEQDMTAEEKNHVEVAKEYSAQNKED